MNTHNIRCHVLMAMLLSLVFSQTLKANAEFCTPSCHGQINLSLPSNGIAVITPASILSGSNNCTDNWAVTVTDANGNVIPGNIINCLYLGQILMASVENTDTGISCWGNILIEDKLPPTITCSDVTIACNDSTDPDSIGMPPVTDNCFGFPTLTYTDVPIEHNCSNPLYDVTIERTWTATDASGNSMSCTQNIFLEKALLSNVVFPPAATIDCSNPNLEPTNTGEPSILGGGGFDGFCNLKYGYNDGSPIATCPGGYKFVREWFVIDCCSNQVLTGNQVINVADTTAPEIICPADLTVSVTGNSCFANSNLPPATATDDCSTATISMSSTSGVITGNIITGLEMGIHTVQYIATDGCGNMDTCEMKITVVDNVVPNAICDGHTVVSLGEDGCAIVRDSTFDDGSTDNCCIDTFYVRRMGDIDFDHFVKFDCDDIGDTVMVEFKVQDKSGNMNFCMVEVTVQDKLPPTVFCPPNKTVNCTNYPLDNSDLGDAFGQDGCDLDTLFFMDDESGLDTCSGIGIILRTWTAVDAQGQSSSCVQTITLIDNSTTTFTPPADITVSCDSLDLSITGTVEITNSCTKYIVSDPIDLILQFDPPDPCKEKILREFVVVNCCTNEPVDTFTQTIIVENTSLPVFTCPGTITRQDFPLPSQPFPNCFEMATFDVSVASGCGGNVTIVSREADNALVTFSSTDLSKGDGDYPVGTTIVTFRAEDECGNQSTCDVTVNVIDFTSPIVGCGDLFLYPTPTMSVDLLNTFIDGGAFECSNRVLVNLPIDQLVKTNFPCSSFSSQTDTVLITVSGGTATDAAGNISGCDPNISREIYIIPNNCTSLPPLLFLAGASYTENYEEVVKGVEMNISGDMDDMIPTGYPGNYFVEGLSMEGTYTVTPEKNNDFLNGVTTFDLLQIKKHLLGNELLDSPYKMIAADVSRDNQITTFDIVSLQQLILQNWDELPNNTSWRFIDAKYVFSDWTNPFADDFPEHIDCVNMTTDMNFQNFIAVKIGDLTGNASSGNLMASDTRSSENIEFTTKDMFLEKNEIYQIPIYAKDILTLEGFQFTMNLNTELVEFLEIEKGLLEKEDFGYRFVEEGLITSSWIKGETEILDSESVLFFVKIKAKESVFLHQAISINSIKTKALAYNESEEAYGIELFFEDKKESVFVEKEKYILYQNQPNPFSETTEIKFYLPENSDVELQILDVSGRTIKTFSNHYLFGEHTIELKSSVFPSTGVYIYKLITPSFSASKKMTIIN